MRPTPRLFIPLTLALAMYSTSCSNSAAPPASAASQAVNSPPVTKSATAPRNLGGGHADPAPAAPTPPAGAQYTVYCTTVSGAAHIPESTRLRDQLARTTRMRDWYVVHNQDDSTLYYGYYRSIDRQDEPKEAARARADREKIDSMVDASGARPFRNALLVEIAAADPDAPSQWDLRRAPPGTSWSLQIAAYEGHPDRKRFAVDAVKSFRQNGVPAFYYHGESVSSVCIGAWPAQAVQGDLEPAFNDPNVKRPMEQIMAQAPGDLIVIAPGLPPVNKEIRTKKGVVRAVSPHLEAVDPTLLAAMKNYPHHYVNGVVEGMKTAQGLQGKPSFLVKIPRQAATLFDSGYDAAVAGAGESGRRRGPDSGALSGMPPGVGFGTGAAASPTRREPTAPPPPPAPGFGRLRSIEDR